MIIDCTGKQIHVGDYIRHKFEPTPPKESGRRGLGYHTHNLFGVKRVKQMMTQVVICEDGYVVLGVLVEVVAGPTESRPYIAPLRDSLMMLEAA